MWILLIACRADPVDTGCPDSAVGNFDATELAITGDELFGLVEGPQGVAIAWADGRTDGLSADFTSPTRTTWLVGEEGACPGSLEVEVRMEWFTSGAEFAELWDVRLTGATLDEAEIEHRIPVSQLNGSFREDGDAAGGDFVVASRWWEDGSEGTAWVEVDGGTVDVFTW